MNWLGKTFSCSKVYLHFKCVKESVDYVVACQLGPACQDPSCCAGAHGGVCPDTLQVLAQRMTSECRLAPLPPCISE